MKAKSVNQIWIDDIKKCKKKYQNIKASYQKYLKLEKFNTEKETVDGHENWRYNAEMSELVCDNNPGS